MTRKISCHCNVTSPISSGYPVLESLRSFANVCDEVIVVDGGSTDGSLEKIKKIDKVRVIEGVEWKRDFDWGIMADNLNIGYGACQYDWAFHFDVDYIFHEKYKDLLRTEIEKTSLPAIEVKKVNFVLSDEYFVKDHYALLAYKKGYPAICYGVSRDRKGNVSPTFLRPIARTGTTRDGLEVGDRIKMANARVYRSTIEIYTYDFTFMTKEQVAEQRERFNESLFRFTGREPIPSREESFEAFIGMMKARHKRCRIKRMKLEEHSKFIKDKVKNIKPEMFGFNGFGEIK